MCVVILWRHVRTPWRVEEVPSVFAWSMAVCLWPICRQTSRPTTSRHIYSTAITRGNAHPGIQPPPPSPPPLSLPPRPSSHHRLVHARVGTIRSLWGLSRLAAYSPLSLCTLRCMLRERAVFPALNFITCSRGTSKAARMPPIPTTYDFIKARCCTSYTRARLYNLTRVYIQQGSCCSACVDLVFAKFWVAVFAPRSLGEPLSSLPKEAPYLRVTHARYRKEK